MKLLRKIIIIICCLLLSWGFVFPVKADSPYYVVSDDYNNVSVWHDGWVIENGSTPGLRQFRMVHATGYNVSWYGFIALVGSDYHVFIINQKSTNSKATIYGRREISSGSFSSQFNFNTNYEYVKNDNGIISRYNIMHLGPAVGDFSDTDDVLSPGSSSVLPVIDFGSASLTKEDIYNYVYNNDFPVSYGTPSVDYTVSVAGTGQAAANNRDNITFNNYFLDGSAIPENAEFRLRVVPGSYQAEDRTSLLVKTFQDFILDYAHLFDLGTYSPGDTASFVWSDLIRDFNFTERYHLGGVLTPFIDNAIWQLLGWSYQYQLVIGDYVSDWETVYSSTSSGASESYTITNTYYNEEVYNAFQTINNVNNVTNNIYNYGGSEVPVSAPTPTPTPSPSPDSTVSDPESHGLLSRIVNFIKNIFSTLGNMFNWLKDLLTGDITDHSSEIQNTMDDVKDDSGMLFGAFEVLDDLESHLVDLDPFPAVMEYDDFKIGDIVIVPAGTLDFRNIWNYIGTTQEEVYKYTDFAIGLSLFWFMTRRVLEALKGSGGSDK